MDGWRIRRKKDAFSNLSGLVWTGPKSRNPLKAHDQAILRKRTMTTIKQNQTALFTVGADVLLIRQLLSPWKRALYNDLSRIITCLREEPNKVQPEAYHPMVVRSQHAPYKYLNFPTNRYCKYLSFLESAFTAVHLQ